MTRVCGRCPRLKRSSLPAEVKIGTVTEESKPSTQTVALALFDLTSLQREANGRFGFSAKNTLGLAQALYEKHKVLTYPADRRAGVAGRLYSDTVKETLGMLKESNNYSPACQAGTRQRLGEAEQAHLR